MTDTIPTAQAFLYTCFYLFQLMGFFVVAWLIVLLVCEPIRSIWFAIKSLMDFDPMKHRHD